MALGRDPDLAVNHDPVAIAMHEANQPGTRHLRQDVWQVPGGCVDLTQNSLHPRIAL